MPLIEAYEAIGRESRALLEAARRRDWESFDLIQDRCRAKVAALRDRGQPPPLEGRDADRRREILATILADDRSIRDILEPCSPQLDAFLRARRPGGAE